MKNTYIWNTIIALSLLTLIPSVVLAEKGNTQGQIGGSFDFQVKPNLKSSLGYYVATDDQLKTIQDWFNVPENMEKVLTAARVYDVFIVVVHPSSVVDGKINPKYTGLFSGEQINELNDRLESLSTIRDECLLVPLAIANKGGKVNLLQFYVFSDDEKKDVQRTAIESCLDSGFSLVW
jgi:hypothetical protein